MQNGESVVLMAETAEGQLAGFCQLYPTFCSVDMAPICVLYDLFVAADFRRQGVAEQLLTAAGQQSKARGACSAHGAGDGDHQHACPAALRVDRLGT
ncbi:GNAT family N-acetyltransferase [Halopseudomonas pachastrellae]|nr:GNAT family N-acetyltransferase [Halopseudomonas pachastrellae]